ncbi:PP2C family protein-serine/threonine phosphatase [Prosthecobacter debontii]|nr:protein phosphatase 2C domain-containing protein [Prosthecobacter debontii]
MTPPSAPTALSWSGMTHVGRVRKNNEDAFLALAYDANEIRYLGKVGDSSLEHHDFVFAVSDGMGGANAGEFASKIAVERITRLMPKVYRLAAQKLATGVNDALEEIFSHVHAEMTRMGRFYAECAGMGATLSLACFSPGWMHFAHVGDSRIYYLPAGGGMMQVTHDHSFVGWLRRQGKLNEREARMHPSRNVLNQALGGGHQILHPHFGAVSCHPGDKFLLCSDGITDGLWDNRLEEYLKTPQDQPKAFKIVERAVAESGKDNCTAVVVEFAA